MPSATRAINQKLANLRRELSYLDPLPQLTILGSLAGVFAAAVIIALRLAIDLPLMAALGDPESFEQLPASVRLALCTGGGLVIGLVMQILPHRYTRVGPAHAIDRIHNHASRFRWQNISVQFFTSSLSLITGQSVGREGPAVHLGAGSGSLVGQWLKLPSNTLRVMAACGVAAAISASFNTPLAGVIFAMEVVLLEYTIAGFIPIILAAFIGSVLTRLVFGDDSVFSVTTTELAGLSELPFLLLTGLALGVVAISYNRLITAKTPWAAWPISVRCTLAGLVTGVIATQVPEVMGLGYDTVASAITENIGLAALAVIIIAKLVATGFSINAGIPGGLIGPTLFIGGLTGALLSIVGATYFNIDSGTGFYVLVGMTAMLGAVLNAPLTALVTILEFTNNPNIIFPSMLVVVVACLFTRITSGDKGIFLQQLDLRGRSVKSTGVRAELAKVGALSVMETDFVTCTYRLNYDDARSLLENTPKWVVLAELGRDKILLRASDLARFLANAPEPILTLEEEIVLEEIAGDKITLAPIHDGASLLEVDLLMKAENTEAVFVQRAVGNVIDGEIQGLISKDTLANYYRA